MEIFDGKKNQVITAACLNIGYVMVGYIAAWTSPVTPKLQDAVQSPLGQSITLTQGSWIGSCLSIGFALGPFITAYLSNAYGRKVCTLLAGLLYFTASILLLTPYCVPQILIARIICGVGGAIIIVNNIIYIGEIASTNIRGILLASTGVSHAFGTLLVNGLGSFSYSIITYTLLALSILHITGSIFVPESPVYYMIKGQDDKTVSILNYLGRNTEIEELKSLNDENIKNVENQKWDWKEMFTVKSNRRSFFIICPLTILQYCSGIMLINYYTTNIFKASGCPVDPNLASIITTTIQFLSTLIVPHLIESAGRRILLILSTSGCCLIFALLGIYFYLRSTAYEVVASVGWLPLLLLILTFIIYSIGLNIVPNTLMGEVFEANMRSVGSSVVVSIASLAVSINVASFGYIVEGYGIHVMFWMFAIINATTLIFTFFVVPETKGMSLAEIQIKLSN